MSDVADCKSRLHATFCLVQLVGKLQACVQDKALWGDSYFWRMLDVFEFREVEREEDGVFLLEGSVDCGGCGRCV